MDTSKKFVIESYLAARLQTEHKLQTGDVVAEIFLSKRRFRFEVYGKVDRDWIIGVKGKSPDRHFIVLFTPDQLQQKLGGDRLKMLRDFLDWTDRTKLDMSIERLWLYYYVKRKYKLDFTKLKGDS